MRLPELGYIPPPIQCVHVLYRATLIDPAEFCDNDAIDDSEYCKRHTIDEYDIADRIRDEREDR